MNTFRLRLHTGKDVDFDYSKTGDLFNILNQHQLFDANDPKVKSTKLIVPDDLPKSRMTEVKNAISHLKLEVIPSEELTWERLGIGGEADWEGEEAMIARGVDVSKEDHKKAFIALVNEFKTVVNKWQKARKAGIVSVDAGFYIKKLEKFQVKRK